MNNLKSAKPLSALRSASLQRLLALWNSRLANRHWPSREDFQPEDMRWILGKLMIVEVESNPQRFRYRLFGTAFTEIILKIDLTGKYLDEIDDPELVAFLLPYYQEVANKGLPLVVEMQDLVGDNLLKFECLMLPLSHDNAKVDMLLIGIDVGETGQSRSS